MRSELGRVDINQIKWDYMVEKPSSEVIESNVAMIGWLDTKGHSGWELIFQINGTFYFKRMGEHELT